MADHFPAGLRIYLRIIGHAPIGLLFNDHLAGRNIVIEDRIINVLGPAGAYLGTYFVDIVAFIVPLETTGPSSANN